jgi:hypothetical protein
MIRMIAAFVLTFLGTGVVTVMYGESNTEANEKAVRSLILKRMKERDKYTASNLDWENAFGYRIRGLAEKQKFMAQRVGPTLSKASEEVTRVTVNMISSQVAVADRYWKLTGQTHHETGAALPDRIGRTTYILRRVDRKWRIEVERIADLRQ